MVYAKEENKKNVKISLKKAVLLLFLSIFVSVLIGFLITQFLIRPYLSKISSSTKYSYSLKMPQLNYYLVKIGEYDNERDAAYNLNLLIMKGIYGESIKSNDKYILSVGYFIDKDEANNLSLKLNKSGIISSVVINNGPIYEISYEENSKDDVKTALDNINSFYNNLSHLTELSYKIAFGIASEKDIDETELYFKKYSEVPYNIRSDNNLKKIVESTMAINGHILNNFKDIKTSFELNDGNAYGLTQKLFIDSISEYYSKMSSLK